MIFEKKDPITKGVNVPISLNKLKEPRIQGKPWFLVVVWGMYFIASVSTSVCLISLHIRVIPALIIPGAFFFILMQLTAKDRKQVLKSYRKLLLFIRIFKKESVFMKYKMSLDDIKKWIPIESIEESGMVRFTNNTSMITFVLDPPRNNSNEESQYNTKVMNVINTLHGEFTYQFCAVSSKESNNNLRDNTVEMLNKEPGQAFQKHLFSIYDYSTKTDEIKQVPDWKFFLFVIMPVSNTTKDAERVKDTLVIGLSNELDRAGILSNVITNRVDCINLLRIILAEGGL